MSLTPESALAALRARADTAHAAAVAARHRAPREHLGVPMAAVSDLAKEWRATLGIPDRVALADSLWRSDIHEARIAAAKLLTQARIRDDTAVWRLIAAWVPDLDGPAISDPVCAAGARRLVAAPARLDAVEGWVHSAHLWTRRAALVMTLPWTRQNFPRAADLAIRDRILGWAAYLSADGERAVRQAVAGWLRDLSRHDPERSRTFLAAHGARLKPFLRCEAETHP